MINDLDIRGLNGIPYAQVGDYWISEKKNYTGGSITYYDVQFESTKGILVKEDDEANYYHVELKKTFWLREAINKAVGTGGFTNERNISVPSFANMGWAQPFGGTYVWGIGDVPIIDLYTMSGSSFIMKNDAPGIFRLFAFVSMGVPTANKQRIQTFQTGQIKIPK